MNASHFPDFPGGQEEAQRLLAEIGQNQFLALHERGLQNVVQNAYYPQYETEAGLDFNDFMNEARWLVMELLPEWDPGRGQSWSTFLFARLKFRLIDFLRIHSHIPRLLSGKFKKIQAAKKRLSQELDRMPTFDELAAALEISAEELSLIMADYRMRHLTQIAPVKRGEPDEESVGMNWDSASQMDSVSNLPPDHLVTKERVSEILRKAGQHWDRVSFFGYLILGLTMKTMAEKFIGLSESRLSQGLSFIMSQVKQFFDDESTHFLHSREASPPERDFIKLWNSLPLRYQHEIVAEMNLASFHFRDSKAERDKARECTISLPAGFHPSSVTGMVSGSAKLCVLVRTAEKADEQKTE